MGSNIEMQLKKNIHCGLHLQCSPTKNNNTTSSLYSDEDNTSSKLYGNETFVQIKYAKKKVMGVICRRYVTWIYYHSGL